MRQSANPANLLVIRHAPTLTPDRLCGRTDVDCVLPEPAVIERMRLRLGPVDAVIASPALRCMRTAAALWPEREIQGDARLWEQDFGDWEGMAYRDLPDLGPLSAEDLARHRPPGGESFADLCDRAAPAVAGEGHAAGVTAIVAHAGAVRAALAHALGSPAAALAFEVAPFSVTGFRRLGEGRLSVVFTNWTPS